MRLSSAVPDRIRRCLLALVASTLAGCSIVPGNQSYSNREESDVRLPVQQGDVLAPANVKIKPITAELIIDMFKAGAAAGWRRDQRRPGSDPEQPAARRNGCQTGTRIQAGSGRHHFDHRLGPSGADHPGR
jgi:hypothetical protein